MNISTQRQKILIFITRQLAWSAAGGLTTQIPNKGKQMVRFGVYPPLAELLF